MAGHRCEGRGRTLGLAALVCVLMSGPACGDDDGSGPDAGLDDAAGLDARFMDSAGLDVWQPPDAGDASLVQGAYFVAPDGDDGNPGTEDQPWRTLAYAAAQVAAGDTVYLRQGTWTERLAPETSGSEGAPITFAAYPGEQPVIDGSSVTLPDSWGGLVELREVSYWQLIGLRVEHAGQDDDHAGILVQASDHILVQGCSTYDTHSSGIGVWRSSEVTVHGNDVELACNDGSQECITMAVSDHFQVSFNVVHHSGPGSNGGEGIDIKDGSHDGVVFGNEVHHTNRLGIYVDAWDAPTYNIGVYGNVVHEAQATGFAVAAENGGLLSDVVVYNNLAWGNLNTGLTVAGWGVSGATHELQRITIINNTFVGNGTNGWGPGIVLENPAADDVVIRNNLLAENGYEQLTQDDVGADLVMDHNLFFGDGSPSGDSPVSGDPLFVDAAGHDYRLQAGSPAIDAASTVNVPATDFDGTARPQGAGPDIGAFERTP